MFTFKRFGLSIEWKFLRHCQYLNLVFIPNVHVEFGYDIFIWYNLSKFKKGAQAWDGFYTWNFIYFNLTYFMLPFVLEFQFVCITYIRLEDDDSPIKSVSPNVWPVLVIYWHHQYSLKHKLSFTLTDVIVNLNWKFSNR